MSGRARKRHMECFMRNLKKGAIGYNRGLGNPQQIAMGKQSVAATMKREMSSVTTKKSYVDKLLYNRL